MPLFSHLFQFSRTYYTREILEMIFDNLQKNRLFFLHGSIIIFACSVFSINIFAQDNGGISLTPSRLEVVIPAGTEKTVGVAVDYTRDAPGELPIVRLAARLEDWALNEKGEIKTAPINTLPRSAASWITFSPSEFTIAPEARQILRFTVSVPKDTPPGDYYLACFVENRLAPPPPTAGKAQLTIRFRFYTLIYVMVPGLSRDGELLGLDTKMVNGFPILSPKLGNKGNSRIRPMQSVEIRDANDKVVFSAPMSEALVVLGGHSWQMPIFVDSALPAGKYKLAYTVDFGERKPLQRGISDFEVTEFDVAARLKKTDPTIAKQTDPVKNVPPTTAVVKTEPAKVETKQTPAIPAADTGAGKSTTAAPIVKTDTLLSKTPPQ
ncbi:MAG: hypothetical protein LH614_03255 [Pyrinomonadaceae bacterium]|nr:hypothetical protein [Pyrinomonadaceae bacterium]